MPKKVEIYPIGDSIHPMLTFEEGKDNVKRFTILYVPNPILEVEYRNGNLITYFNYSFIVYETTK